MPKKKKVALTRFTPKSENIRQTPSHPIRLITTPPNTNLNPPRPIRRRHSTREVLKSIILALPINRITTLPDPSEDLDVLLCSRVALVFAEEVAFACLLDIAAAGDEMHDDTAAGELVKGCEGFGGDGGVECVGAESDDYVEVLGVG